MATLRQRARDDFNDGYRMTRNLLRRRSSLDLETVSFCEEGVEKLEQLIEDSEEHNKEFLLGIIRAMKEYLNRFEKVIQSGERVR